MLVGRGGGEEGGHMSCFPPANSILDDNNQKSRWRGQNNLIRAYNKIPFQFTQGKNKIAIL